MQKDLRAGGSLAVRVLWAAVAVVMALWIFTTAGVPVSAETENNSQGALRRPVSNEQPMWIVHIDTWNYADPEAIIELVPEDVKPYVVFNISLSVNWDSDLKRFMTVEYGYETARSWVRSCAENNVWCMIQPASGGPCHFPDYDSSVDYDETLFAEFFRDYPNFIGYNYCEQFWGFDQEDFPTTAEQRYEHFASLLALCNKYGGYLVDSWCANQWSPAISPIAMLKKIPEFKSACESYSQNFILLEKYTQVGYISDVESLVEGIWLSGYSGNFGVRYDDTGWTDSTWNGEGDASKNEYRSVTSLAVYLERFMLNGATVIDGPEIIWTECFKEIESSTSKDGYTTRNWDIHEQFEAVTTDFFRQVLNGTIRIPTREEIIKRTKLIIINDVETGNDDAKYSTPASLTEGLYRMDGDGALKDNHTIYKKTGRYPTIPMSTGLADSLAKSFEIVINKSEYTDAFPTVEEKVEYFDSLFPEEYTGDIYAGRYENRWVVYCPYKNMGGKASGELELKYNTCSTIGFQLPRYSNVIVNEYSDRIELYLNNYDEDAIIPATDVITVAGCSSEPEFSYDDRGRVDAKISSEYSNGVFTLSVTHVGPMDITINCSGSETGRLTEFREAVLVEPEAPPVYSGTLQHEAEVFEFKSIESYVSNGARESLRDYTGQGYIILGSDKDASVRDSFKVLESGKYRITLRYISGAEGTMGISSGMLNSSKLELLNTGGEWQTASAELYLNEGDNHITLNAAGSMSGVYLDNITVDFVESGVNLKPIALIAGAVVVVIAIAAAVVIKAKKGSKKS